MERGLQTLAQYLKWCHELEVQKVFAVGTSALREAKNSKDFLKLVKEKIELPIDIISGEEEAHLSFLAVQKDLGEIEEPLLVVDVGGGEHRVHPGKKRSDQSMDQPSIGICPFYRTVLTLRSCSRKRMG